MEQVEDPGLRDRISRLIEDGEGLRERAPDAFSEDSLRRDVGAFIVEAAYVLADADLHGRFTDADPHYSGPQTGQGYLTALLTAKIRVLYELRDHLPRDRHLIEYEHNVAANLASTTLPVLSGSFNDRNDIWGHCVAR